MNATAALATVRVQRHAAAAYGLLGLPLAFVALPVYVHLPNVYAQQYGVPLAALGAVLLLSRSIDAVVDPWLGRWGDRLYRHSWGAVWLAAILMAVLVALGFAAAFFPPGKRPVACGFAGVGGRCPHDQPFGLQRLGHLAPGLGSPSGWGRHRAKPLGGLARGLCPGGRFAGVCTAGPLGLGVDHGFVDRHVGGRFAHMATHGPKCGRPEHAPGPSA
jgi:hypothetical protein